MLFNFYTYFSRAFDSEKSFTFAYNNKSLIYSQSKWSKYIIFIISLNLDALIV